MLSQETEKRLATLLMQIHQCEITVEKSRQDLCKNLNFDVYSAFRLIDNATNGKISVLDLQNFLSRRNVSITRLHLELLISQYDSNMDKMLSLEEFQALVLPSEDLELREETLTRNIYPPTLYVESILARHIELEANFQGELQTYKRNLFIREDFNPIDAFRAIDLNTSNFLTSYALKEFLKKHKYIIDIDDLETIIRRIDIDCDMKISYEEFVEGILPVNRNPLVKKPKKNHISSTRKIKSRITSRAELRSPKKNTFRSTTSYNLHRPVRSKLFDNVQEDDFQEIITILSTQIYLDRDTEQAKIILSSHKDFNISDIFKILDIEYKKYIDCYDIENLLRELQVPFHIDEIYLIVKRYCSYDHKLDYSNIEKLFLPINKDHCINIINRPANKYFDGLRTFSADTLDDLISLMKTMLRNENHAETLRKRLAVRS